MTTKIHRIPVRSAVGTIRTRHTCADSGRIRRVRELRPEEYQVAAERLYIDSLRSHIDAQDELIAALRGEIAAKDEIIDIRDTCIEALLPCHDAGMQLLGHLEKSNGNLRVLGVQFRAIADTGREIQALLQHGNPCESIGQAIGGLQSIIDSGNLLADTVAEIAYNAIPAQLSEGSEVENGG